MTPSRSCGQTVGLGPLMRSYSCVDLLKSMDVRSHGRHVFVPLAVLNIGLDVHWLAL